MTRKKLFNKIISNKINSKRTYRFKNKINLIIMKKNKSNKIVKITIKSENMKLLNKIKIKNKKKMTL
jgi:hypothetical protein